MAPMNEWRSSTKKKTLASLSDNRSRKDFEQRQGRDDDDESACSAASSVSDDCKADTPTLFMRNPCVEYDDASYDDSSRNSDASSVSEAKNRSNMKIVYKSHNYIPEQKMKLVRSDKLLSVKKDQVIVKVEASTVSSLDCEFRRGDFRPHFKRNFSPTLPATPGIDCVGIIVKCGSNVSQYGFFNGDKVAALSISGGNSRYLTLSVDDIVKVPDAVDSVEAACLVATYVEAFQALNIHNSIEERFTTKPLKGKNLLINGGSRLMNHVLIQLSKLLGAKTIYCPSRQQNHEWITSLGGNPMPYYPDEWLPELANKIDLAVDGVCLDGYDSPRKALTNEGNLVCIGMSDITKKKDIIAGVEALWTETTTRFMSQTEFYSGVIQSKIDNREQYQYDLEYLIKLLATGKIRPPIHRKIPLRKVPLAHSILDQVEKDGFIVCQPWMK